MSGQPYRYYTDPQKYRTMFMDTLELQANINAMNLEANKTYKETGQLPAVSQMKEMRTTSEILADALKLKIDITQAIAKVSNQQFGQLVVQRIESSPLNIDNRLLVFTAQRIDDIVDNLKKIYKYGIKGDTNDAEQLVSFVSKMYNDKNSITAQTKSFMESQGIRSIMQSGNVFLNLSQFLSRLSVKILSINKESDEMSKIFEKYSNNLIIPFRELIKITAEIASLSRTITDILPANEIESSKIEEAIIRYSEGIDQRMTPTQIQRGQLTVVPSEFDSWTLEKQEREDALNTILVYLDFINTNLPQIGLMTSSIAQVDTYFNQLNNTFNNNIFPILKHKITPQEYYENIVNKGLEKATKINIEKLVQVCNNLYGILLPNTEWNEFKIKQLKTYKNNLIKLYTNVEQPIQQPTMQPQQPTIQTQQPVQQPVQAQQPSREVINEALRELRERIRRLIDVYNNENGFTAEEIDSIIIRMQQLYKTDNTLDFRINDPINPSIEELYNALIDSERSITEIVGEGLKRRGRPKGSGIGKRKTYKEIVKANSAVDKGILETPRFVKFGKYLVNNHRLNNEDIFALKRPSGGNIVEIPSVKVSKNLSSVIKKMVGGEIPTYSDISKLSEPEKAYLHKISKKSNILDKFDIPAPSKDALERDIHQFEVMKGEILAGNDNKELIRKFKAHILKLSKNGTLPKREVQEILQDLLELNI